MKATYRTLNGRISFEVEGDAAKDLFKAIAQLQAMFDTDTACGLCSSEDICFSMRTVDGNDYYDLLCRSCHASLGFGQHKKGGTLFVKRKDQQGNILPNEGWRKWGNRTAGQDFE